MSVSGALRNAVTVASPRHRAWKGLLASLTLDPDDLPHPVSPPGTRDFLMCGSPRSGTALLVAMLYQPPSVVTVMEPWDALRFPPAELFASFRDELASTRRLSRGRLDTDALEQSGSVTWCRDGERPHNVEVEDGDFLLGIKFPAFWRYLDLLPDTKFLVCLRNPVEVIRSYEHTGGQLGEGLDYDVPFNRAMNDRLRTMTKDPAVRRVLLYDYIHAQIVPHLGRPNVHLVRYERWFTEPEEQLGEIATFLGVRLERPKVRLRPPSSAGTTTPAERELLHRYCPTAPALGYEV
jgi:hypothetical protein